MKFLIFVLITITAGKSLAQIYHVHELVPKLDMPAVKGAKVHKAPNSLVEAQLNFQKAVFKKAEVENQIKSLTFVEKESLLEVIENEKPKDFIKLYPSFSISQARKLKAALYE